MSEVERKLAKAGVYAGLSGLEGLLNCREFWEDQPYGTRLYYGPGAGQYLHRDVLAVAVKLLSQGVGGEPGEQSDSQNTAERKSARQIDAGVLSCDGYKPCDTRGAEDCRNGRSGFPCQCSCHRNQVAELTRTRRTHND